MEATLPNQTSCSQQPMQEEEKHKHNHVHIHNHHHNYTHLHNQLKEHLTTGGGGVSQEICKCQLEEMLLGDEEEARLEKVKAKIEERKRRATEGRKGVSDATDDAKNYDIDQALLFIEGENKRSKPSCLRRGAKYSDKKKQCKNMQKAEMFNNVDNIDSDDESVKTMEVASSWTVEDKESLVDQQCHSNDENGGFHWTEVNMRKKKKTSKKDEKIAHLFTIEDLSHNVCHGNSAPVDNPRCQQVEKEAKGQVWGATCQLSQEEQEPGKALSEEDFPSLQSCAGWRRKPGKVAEKKVGVVKEEVPEQIVGDEADAQEEKGEVVGQEGACQEDQEGDQEGDQEVDQDVGCQESSEKRDCDQLTEACCLRDMFQFPGTICFCFCDSGEISTVSNCVKDKQVEEPRIGMTRMHAMLSGLVVPFGKF